MENYHVENYHYDGLGSVRQLTDSTGTAAANSTYDAFGNLRAGSGAADNPYGFTGEQQFSEADDLVFLRARYYKPSIGRFVSRDPIGYADGMNIYAYVRNNPVMRRDPTGLAGVGKAGCRADCRAKFDDEFATAGWLHNLAVAACDAGLELCLKGCLKIPGCGKLGDAGRRSCSFLCSTAHGACISGAYGLYVEAVAGATFNYGVCMGACEVLYE